MKSVKWGMENAVQSGSGLKNSYQAIMKQHLTH